MNSKTVFWTAFGDELAKEAGLEQLLAKSTGFLGRVRAAASPHVRKGQQWFAGTGVGRWLSRHPRVSNLLGFAGSQMLVGGALASGEMPFRRRRRIVHVLPEPGGNDFMLHRPYRTGGR